MGTRRRRKDASWAPHPSASASAASLQVKKQKKWLSLCGGLKLWDPLTKSPAGRGPGPATLAMSSPGQASKYMDYWRANKGESCKQTCDKLGWYLADLGMLPLVFYQFNSLLARFYQPFSIYCHWRTSADGGWGLQHVAKNSRSCPAIAGNTHLSINNRDQMVNAAPHDYSHFMHSTTGSPPVPAKEIHPQPSHYLSSIKTWRCGRSLMWIFKLWLFCVKQNKIVDWQNFWWLNYRVKRKGNECLSVFLLFFNICSYHTWLLWFWWWILRFYILCCI